MEPLGTNWDNSARRYTVTIVRYRTVAARPLRDCAETYVCSHTVPLCGRERTLRPPELLWMN